MKSSHSRRKAIPDSWPHRVRCGRVEVTVYRRIRSDGQAGFEVANYATDKRRLESFPDPTSALDRANQLARQLSEQEVVAASMTNEQAADFAAVVQTLARFQLSLPAVASTVAECLQLVGDLPNLHAAAKFYATRHKQTERKAGGGCRRGTAAAAGIKWKGNALRHSYASYRFALTNDAGRVAGELGNSASVVHKHYRELVTLKSIL